MTHIAGVDEAGRGPWAGPVVTAAVILPANSQFDGLDDSKKVAPAKRERLFAEIMASEAIVAWQFVQVPAIDKYNILRATLRGMSLAVERLAVKPDQVLVDGRDIPLVSMPCKAIIGGDGKEAAIAAASIVAKVLRDRYMVRLGEKYPAYGFAAHKGYGTKQHQAALAEWGPTRHHRKSFKPIQAYLTPSSVEVIGL
jgi:ribonuclease HII